MGVTVSVILPCRNEEKTIEKCIKQIKRVFKKENIDGEIIVSDSSSDNSALIAKKHNTVVIKHNEKGYGIAIRKGFEKAKGKYVVIGDADATYDFSELSLLLKKLKSGYDLVIGSRIKGTIKKGAMPWHHRYIGNPGLSFILNLFFSTKVSDTHSGLRVITKDSFEKLELKTTGMEFASEMIIKAAKNGLAISEVPITYYPRIGESKLRSFSDAWRHLRFMLMFSPTYLFFIPGFVLFFLGFLVLTLILFGSFIIRGVNINLYLALFGSFFSILGYQVINLGLYSKIYAIHTGFEKQDKLINYIAEKVPLEKGVLSGFLIVLFSILLFLFKPNYDTSTILFPLTLTVIGFQTFFSVFFISIMLVEKKD